MMLQHLLIVFLTFKNSTAVLMAMVLNPVSVMDANKIQSHIYFQVYIIA